MIFSCLMGMILVPPQLATTEAYVPPEIRQQWKDQAATIRQDSIKLIEECCNKGINSDSPKLLFFEHAALFKKDPQAALFWAVKYLDRHANNIYATISDKQALLDQTNGSWELRLAVNSDRDEEFYPHPEFRNFAKAFCTIQDNYYGKGIGSLDDGFCFVALGGPSTRDVARRRVFMNYEDFFINGGVVPSWDLSYYLRGFNQQLLTAEQSKQTFRLAFTVICCTNSTLVVRGSKTGGMAIFRRIATDMSGVAGFNNRGGVV